MDSLISLENRMRAVNESSENRALRLYPAGSHNFGIRTCAKLILFPMLTKWNVLPSTGTGARPMPWLVQHRSKRSEDN